MEMGKLAVAKPGGPRTFLSNAWASTTLILNQVPNIADGWNSINEARYKVEKYRVIMQIIRLIVDKMSDGVNTLEPLKMDWEESANSETKIMIRIRTEASRLHRLYITSRTKIDDLKISMNKTKRSLMRLQRHQRTNMLGSSIHFATNLLEYCAAEEAASSTMVIVQGLLVGLVVANGVVYWIAGKELENPRNIKIEILALDNRVEELKNCIVEAEKWIQLNGEIELNDQI